MKQGNNQIREISKEESRFIWILKCVAIFFVVSAHLYPVAENASEVNQMASQILYYMGSMGVPIFYVISGYLFAGNRKDFKGFWKSKIKTIFIPWIFCYTLLYLYVVLRKGGASPLSYFQMLIGYQSTAYFLSMLIVMYLIFWISKRSWYIAILMGVSVFSIISTGWEVGINGLNDLCGTFYLNPLNWILFFGLGLLIRKRGWNISFGKGIWALPLGGLSVVYMIIMHKMDEPVYYFSKFALIAHVINIPLLFCVAAALFNLKTTLLENVGRKTFSIYLTHQLIAGTIITVTNILINPGFVLLRPIITVAIVYIGLVIIEKIFGKTKWVPVLLGLR